MIYQSFQRNKKIYCEIFIFLIIYGINKLFLVNQFNGILSVFLRNYFNDLLCPFIFLGICKLVLDFLEISFEGYLKYLLLILFAAIIWEFIIPIFDSSSVSDILDIVFYLIGMNVFYFFFIRN